MSKLLWEAYPDGCLAMCGVSTVGGWGYTTTGWIAPINAHLTWAESFISQLDAKSNGDKLPLLDPENDPATWACAKKEMAEALGWPSYINIGWWKMRQGFWQLHGSCSDETRQEDGKYSSKRFHGIETDDPIKAFLKARASLRI